MEWTGSLLLQLIAGVIGYIFGSARAFREQKQSAYGAILPPIIRAAYRPTERDEPEFNQALAKLWLYSGKRVAKKMEHVVECLHDPDRGDLAVALQAAISEMRRDIQFLPWQKLDPGEIRQLYTTIGPGWREQRNGEQPGVQ